MSLLMFYWSHNEQPNQEKASMVIEILCPSLQSRRNVDTEIFSEPEKSTAPNVQLNIQI